MVEEVGIYEEEFGMYIIQMTQFILQGRYGFFLQYKKRLPDLTFTLVEVKQALFLLLVLHNKVALSFIMFIEHAQNIILGITLRRYFTCLTN